VTSLILDVAESVTADHRAAVHDHASSETAAFTNHHVGVEEGIITDGAIVADKDPRIEGHPRADGDAVPEGHAGPDRHIRADGDVLAAGDALGNAAHAGRSREKLLGGPCKGIRRIVHHELR